ncbi:hypothetical protein BGZ63DRAFT_379652 [Mariannaea sp. PMI_226]|nr:hypothetical protein BGZ63DRAFT_379652 [Mariannaea sp. PMI_226]
MLLIMMSFSDLLYLFLLFIYEFSSRKGLDAYHSWTTAAPFLGWLCCFVVLFSAISSPKQNI